MPAREWTLPVEMNPRNALEQLQMQKILNSMHTNPLAKKAYKQYRKSTKGGERWSKEAWMLLNYPQFAAESRISDPHIEVGGLYNRIPRLR